MPDEYLVGRILSHDVVDTKSGELLATANDEITEDHLVAFRKALEVLCSDEPTRIHTIQMILSDPRSELLPELDRKSAFGAYPIQEEAR